MYGRAWGWGAGVRAQLGSDRTEKLSPKAKQLHGVVKTLRDKWVAHAVNRFDDIRMRIDVSLYPDRSMQVRGVSVGSRNVGGFLREWMIAFRSLIGEVAALVQEDIRSESERLSTLVKSLPIEEVTSRERADHVPIELGQLKPEKICRKFHDE
jgi:hypothetical protein